VKNQFAQRVSMHPVSRVVAAKVTKKTVVL